LQCSKIEKELNATIIHQVGFITVLYRPKADISEVQ